VTIFLLDYWVLMRNLAKFPPKTREYTTNFFLWTNFAQKKKADWKRIKTKKYFKMDLNVWWKRRKSKRMPELVSLWWAPTGFPFKASIMYCAYGDRRGGCQQSRKLSLATCQTLRLWYFGEDLKCERILSQNAKKESKIEAFVISSVAVVSIKCYSRPLFFDCCFRL